MKQRRVLRPTLIEQHRAFYLVDQVFDQLKRGEVDAIQGEPHFMDPIDGRWYQLAAAMDGWCEAWARLIRRYRLDHINLAPVLQLVRMLHNGAPVTPDLVDRARETIDAARKAYRGMDVAVVRQIIRDTRISIELQDQGVIPARTAEEVLSCPATL